MKGYLHMNKNDSISSTYLEATGNIRYNMTNDYMFRVVNQKNQNVTKGIICSVLHLNPDYIKSIEITNPIELGEDIDDKTFVLDVNVLLNNSSIINLEMQVVNEHNWQDRSLSYLCRSFDQLYQGETYSSAKPAIHVGFLNFQPFPDYQEFHATYKLMNSKNSRIYSDKFRLNVVDLTHINLATDADKESQLDLWAKFFTAKTWEDIIMMAEKNPYIAEAAQTLYESNVDEITEMKCRARRDYYKQKNTTEKMMRELTEKQETLLNEIETLTDEKKKLVDEKEKLTNEKEKLANEKEKLLAHIKELEKQLNK